MVDLEADTVQKFTSDGRFILKWGTQGSEPGQILGPESVAVDHTGFIYVADRMNYRIQKFTPDGHYVTGWEGLLPGTDDYNGFKGMDVDSGNHIYVADQVHHTIHKYDSEGNLVTKWGGPGIKEGAFNSPSGVAVDEEDNVYVVDAGNHRIQKFTSDGEFVLQWGKYGSRDENFDFGEEDTEIRGGITVDMDGFVYVSDTGNSCIKKFTSRGEFLEKQGIADWQYTGVEKIVFSHPAGLDTDENGSLYVTDPGNPGIMKLSGDRLLAHWGGAGKNPGTFNNPAGLALDLTGNIFVCDQGNHRIQKFSSHGELMAVFGKKGPVAGDFDFPAGIAMDGDGNIYVVDMGNNRIQKLTQKGGYLAQWGKEGAGPGEFSRPSGVAIDPYGNIYVTDSNNHRVQKFTPDGDFILEWGSLGTEDGKFDTPNGIVVDRDGHVYVSDDQNGFIQKFNLEGKFLSKMSGDFGTGEYLNSPADLALDDEGNLYVADKWGTRVLVFNSRGELTEVLGSMGSEPGRFSLPVSLAVSPSGERLYVGECPNNRIQVFTRPGSTQPVLPTSVSKAIIVAGGGPYPGNSLWDATQLCANYAYRALAFQGFTKESLYYLTSDMDLDLDGNHLSDDVDADTTNAALREALTSWALDAETLVLYITDHGGDKIFRMGDTELLTAGELREWLDQFQDATGARLILIIDACRSGSFLPELANPDYDRVIIASTARDQQAYFTSMGQMSFSYYFWGNIFNGMSLYDGYLLAKNSSNASHPLQTPILDADGNGVGNEESDLALIRKTYIGNGTVTADDLPSIGQVSDPVTLTDGSTLAEITADDVIDLDGISRVWAVITPPGGGDDPSDPVLELPEMELVKSGKNEYRGNWDGFTQNGTYHLAVFARDTCGTLSIPKSTTVIQSLGESQALLSPSLELTLPCIRFQGASYQTILAFHENPLDKNNLYFKTRAEAIGWASSGLGNCAVLNGDLSITIPKVKFLGQFYQISLNHHPDPADPSWLYWRLELSSVKLL